MNTTSHKPYKLNSKQIHLLKLIHKFRFVNTLLLSKYRDKTETTSTYLVLKILLREKYIDRYYNGSYKLAGKPATYFLTRKGLDLLRDEHEYIPALLTPQYKNKSVGNDFVEHNLEVMQAFLSLRASYPDTFHIFTRPDLGEFDYFPKPSPDFYLNRIKPSDSLTNEYLLDIFTDPQLFVIRKRINAYIEHFQSGDWEATTKTDYPGVLIVCPNSRLEERLAKQIVRALDSIGETDLLFYTTTLKALLNSDKNNNHMWTQVFEEDELVSLSEIIIK
ncbi:MAG TPA: replication-relaxation family protein [Candidatus Saccharimonadales bacterium]|nr:replication-relaxation family protein [Candidatus Saccharimonadales bacterium]